MICFHVDDERHCTAELKRTVYESDRPSGEMEALNRKITYSTPVTWTLATHHCLLQSLGRPCSVWVPVKCSRRAATSALVYCGHLKAVWSRQSCFGRLDGESSSTFSCTFPPAHLRMTLSRHTTHQGHCCLTMQYGHLLF